MTSLYDSVLSFIYKTLYSSMNTTDKETFKKEHIKWLFGERLQAFKEDVACHENDHKSAENSMDSDKDAFITKLTEAYGTRIFNYLTHHKDILERFFYTKLAEYSSEQDIPKPLKVAFFWNIYVNYYTHDTGCYRDSQDTSNGYRYYDDENEMRMAKINDDEWLVMFRGNMLLGMTNRDGGVLSFWIINHRNKSTRKLKVEDNYIPVESQSRKKVFLDSIQAYPISIDKETIVVGHGNYQEQNKEPEETYYYQLDQDKAHLELVRYKKIND